MKFIEIISQTALLQSLPAVSEEVDHDDPCAAAGYHVCGRMEHGHLTKGQR